LWENVAEHIDKLGESPTSLGATQIRVLKTRAYLAAYSLDGIAVPHGSSIISDLVVPGIAATEYNIRSWMSVFDMLGVIDKVSSMPAERLAHIKLRPEVATGIATIRELLSKGVPSDSVVNSLQQRQMLKGFVRAFCRN
jgi:hypothetical protein